MFTAGLDFDYISSIYIDIIYVSKFGVKTTVIVAPVRLEAATFRVFGARTCQTSGRSNAMFLIVL